eukprot:1161269-Pelagomonas_calceolata.AAC.15
MMMRLFKEEIYKQDDIGHCDGHYVSGRLCHPKTPANASFLPYGCDLKKEQTALPGCVGGN